MKSLWQLLTASLLAILVCQNVVRAEDAPPKDDRANIRTQLAAEYYRRAQYGTAVEEAKKAISINPKYAPAYSMLGVIYMEIREDVQARDYFKQALALAPNDSDIHHNFGFFLCDRGEYLAGIAEYMAALRDPLYQNQEKTLTDAGGCAEKAGKQEDARSYYERALRFQANSVPAKYQLARLLLKTGKLPEARRYALELARQSNPPQAEILWLAVLVERQLGNKEGEYRFSDQLRRLFPESLETSKLLAGQYD